MSDPAADDRFRDDRLPVLTGPIGQQSVQVQIKGQSPSDRPEYRAWRNMLNRRSNPQCPESYPEDSRPRPLDPHSGSPSGSVPCDGPTGACMHPDGLGHAGDHAREPE